MWCFSSAHYSENNISGFAWEKETNIMRRGENFKNTYDIPNGHLITGLIKAENKKGPLI